MAGTVFVFPGQGAQRVGMGRSFFDGSAAARGVFAEASQVSGLDLADLCFNGPEERLRETDHAQIALYTVSMAALAALRAECSLEPAATAGHSVGEYAALTAAGVLTLADGARLVCRRGQLMRAAAAANPGTMAAVLGLEAEAARSVCEMARRAGHKVYVANYNGGGQVVISGSVEGVEAAAALLKSSGAKRIIPLTVAGAFHTPFMVTAGDALYQAISKTPFAKPKARVILNVSAEYLDKLDDLIAGLTMQVSRSVLWEQSMRRLLDDGYTQFVELGSGDVLTGLMRRIERSVTAVAVQNMETLRSARGTFSAGQEDSTIEA